MKKFIKNFVIIFLIFMLVLSSCFIGENNVVYGSYTDNQKKCGNTLAAFCINFYENFNSQTKYDDSYQYDIKNANQPRAKVYLTGNKYQGYYAFDCVGWVSFATKFSLKIGGKTIDSPWMAMCPGSTWNGTYNSNCLEVVAGKVPPYYLGQAPSLSNVSGIVEPGDILFTTGINHVLIYVGEGQTIGSEGGTSTLKKRPLSSYSYSTIMRINPKTADEVIKSGKATPFFNGQGQLIGTDIKRKWW